MSDSAASSRLEPAPGPKLLLGVDTCGPSGSVALGMLTGEDLKILGYSELEGRSYSANLVAAVDGLLKSSGHRLDELDGIVAVNGPGSFTGVRVGLSSVKGLAEGVGIPVAAVSRLLLLSRKAGVSSSALDAHRGEIFLRIESAYHDGTELLAGAGELALIESAPPRIAVCDEAAPELLGKAYPQIELVRVDAPNATDAIRFAGPLLAAGKAVDVALLDGHYLRQSDAEIFGKPAPPERQEP